MHRDLRFLHWELHFKNVPGSSSFYMDCRSIKTQTAFSTLLNRIKLTPEFHHQICLATCKGVILWQFWSFMIMIMDHKNIERGLKFMVTINYRNYHFITIRHLQGTAQVDIWILVQINPNISWGYVTLDWDRSSCSPSALGSHWRGLLSHLRVWSRSMPPMTRWMNFHYPGICCDWSSWFTKLFSINELHQRNYSATNEMEKLLKRTNR